MQTYNWCILGQGVISVQLAQALMQEHGEIYAIAGRNVEKVCAFASAYHCLHCYSIEEMLADEKVDIVYIATPHTYHYEFMMKAIAKGKHVLCEKAICVNHKQLMDAVALAKEKKVILMEAMSIFHMPIYQKAKALIEQGAIGKLKMVQVNFGSCKEYDVTNRFFSKALAGGALLDIGTYALSFARYFLNQQPTTILTNMISFETGVDEMSGIILKNDVEEMAVVSLTMRAKMPKKGIIAGDQGYIEITDYPRADAFTLTCTSDGKETRYEAGETIDALRYEVRDMEIAIQTKKNDTLDLSCDVMQIMSDVREEWKMKYPFE